MMDGAQAQMPQYQCHKKVWALKIKEIRRTQSWGNAEYHIVPEDPGFAPIGVDKDWVLKHTPAPGGYYVVYDDGYKSYSPAAAFEAGYTRI